MSLDSSFLQRLWEAFSDISNSLIFLDIKKAELRNSILNDWLLDVPWQLTLWRLCKPSLPVMSLLSYPCQNCSGRTESGIDRWHLQVERPGMLRTLFQGPLQWAASLHNLSCVNFLFFSHWLLVLVVMFVHGIQESWGTYPSSQCSPWPAQQIPKKPVALPPSLKLFSLTIIICGCLDASWGSMFWSGSASPLSQELLEELTANRFSLPQCGLMSNSAQWELTSWQTQSISGGWGRGERTSLAHAFKRHRAISQMDQQSSCKWYKSIFNSLSISLEAGAGARDPGIKISVPGTK